MSESPKPGRDDTTAPIAVHAGGASPAQLVELAARHGLPVDADGMRIDEAALIVLPGNATWLSGRRSAG